MKMPTADLWEFEDFIDESKIFVSGITGKPRHREAYGTIMDFALMEKFLLGQKDNYTLDAWKYLQEHFRYYGYLSPMNTLVANEINRVIFGK